MTEEQKKALEEAFKKKGYKYNEQLATLYCALVGYNELMRQIEFYKLTRFEFDLLESEFNKKFTFYNIPVLMEMQRRGYYKGIPDNAPIEEILKNSICLE